MKNNINLDELFSKAKNAEPVFSKDDANTLIENASIASTGRLLNKKIKRNTLMNILSAAAVTAIAVGVISYNSLTKNYDNINQKSIQIVQNDKFQTNDLNPNPKQTISEISIAEASDKNTVEKVAIITKTDESNSGNVNWEKDVIQGVNIIELTAEQAKNIGITIGDNADCIQYISGQSRQNPELVKIFVDWGVGVNQIHSTDKKKLASSFEPRMVTDNFGNKRISTFNEDESSNLSRLEFMDKDKNLYIQSITSKDSDKNLNVVMGDMNFTPNSDIKMHTMSNSNSMGLSSIHQKPDDQSKSVKIDNDKVVLTTQNFYYDNNPLNTSTMNLTTTNSDSSTTEINLNNIMGTILSNKDEILNKLAIPDSQKELIIEKMFQFKKDSTMNFFENKNLEFDLKIDSSFIERLENRAFNLDKNKRLKFDSIMKVNSYKKVIVVNTEQNDSKTLKNKYANFNIIRNNQNETPEIDSIINQLSSISDELIILNKLVPVAINIPNAKDRNGKELKNFRFVLWFEPTDDFVTRLPDNIKSQLQNELTTLKNTTDICENREVIAGQETYLDVWRACSGAIENLTTYPNPVENLVNVKFKLNEKRTVNFSIHDLNGRKVQELGKAILTNGLIERSFEVKNLESGMYLIVAQTDAGEQAVQRIIIK